MSNWKFRNVSPPGFCCVPHDPLLSTKLTTAISFLFFSFMSLSDNGTLIDLSCNGQAGNPLINQNVHVQSPPWCMARSGQTRSPIKISRGLISIGIWDMGLQICRALDAGRMSRSNWILVQHRPISITQCGSHFLAFGTITWLAVALSLEKSQQRADRPRTIASSISPFLYSVPRFIRASKDKYAEKIRGIYAMCILTP